MQSRRQKKKKSKILPLTLSLFGLLLIGLYLVGSAYYKDHFFYGTEVNGENIANKTLVEANTLLQKKAPQTLFTIKDKGQDFKTLTMEDFGVKTDFSATLKEIKDTQNSWLFPKAFFAPHKSEVKDAIISKDAVVAYGKQLETELQTANKDKQAPQDAKLALVDGAIQVQPEVPGTQIDTKKVLTEFEKAMTTDGAKKELDLNDYLLQPAITKDNPDLNKQMNMTDIIGKIDASYIINGEKITIPKETILSWVIFDGEKITLDQGLVGAYVNQLGIDYNTSSKPLQFASTKQGTKEVPAGSLGWTIKVNDETAALTEQILKGESFERVPLTVGSGEVKGERIGKTYIEVDLKNQHMWYYKDGKVALETDIVSGKPNTPTPTGVFYVWNKERNATLRGLNDDGSKYASPVDYWMPIDWEGVGIHDSNWQPTYGGDWWKQNGSHGCVNTPPAVMKKLFEMIEVGTPVIVL